jgi:hypothetical protein
MERTVLRRRWLRATLKRYYSAKRLYPSDPDFYEFCEGFSDYGVLPIHTDANGRTYCVWGPDHDASMRVFEKRAAE